MDRNKGFTLVELLIAVAIVGIIAAVGVPAYQDQVQKSRRAEATTMLLEMSQLQERYRLENGAYTTSLGDLGYTLAGDWAKTPNEEYKIRVQQPGNCILPSCFRLLARPIKDGQLTDGRLRLWSDGRKQRNAAGSWVTGWS